MLPTAGNPREEEPNWHFPPVSVMAYLCLVEYCELNYMPDTDLCVTAFSEGDHNLINQRCTSQENSNGDRKG